MVKITSVIMLVIGGAVSAFAGETVLNASTMDSGKIEVEKINEEFSFSEKQELGNIPDGNAESAETLDAVFRIINLDFDDGEILSEEQENDEDEIEKACDDYFQKSFVMLRNAKVSASYSGGSVTLPSVELFKLGQAFRDRHALGFRAKYVPPKKESAGTASVPAGELTDLPDDEEELGNEFDDEEDFLENESVLDSLSPTVAQTQTPSFGMQNNFRVYSFASAATRAKPGSGGTYEGTGMPLDKNGHPIYDESFTYIEKPTGQNYSGNTIIQVSAGKFTKPIKMDDNGNLILYSAGEVDMISEIRGTGEVWFARGKWCENSNQDFAEELTGKLYIVGAQLCFDKAETIHNDLVFGQSVWEDPDNALASGTSTLVGSLELANKSAEFMKTTTIIKEGTKFAFQNGGVLTLHDLNGVGDIETVIVTSDDASVSNTGKIVLGNSVDYTGTIKVAENMSVEFNEVVSESGEVGSQFGGTIDVASGGTLNIDKTNIGVANVVLNEGAVMTLKLSESSNLSIDNLTLSEGSKIVLDLSSIQADTLDKAISLISSNSISFPQGGDIADYIDFENSTFFDGFSPSMLSIENNSLTLSLPEPSMFGLFAGLGTLALATSRRRRSRK